MIRNLLQICLLAVISSSSAKLPNCQEDFITAKGMKFRSLEEGSASEYSDQQLRIGGSASERRNDRTEKKLGESYETQELIPTNKLSSGYANSASFLEHYQNGGSYTRFKRFINVGCLFGFCAPDQNESKNYQKDRLQVIPKEKTSLGGNFISNVSRKLICAFKNCDQNYKLQTCPNICKEPKNKLRAKVCIEMGCGPKPQENILESTVRKQKICQEFCKSPTTDEMTKTCIAFECIPEVANQEIPKPSLVSKPDTCPDSCKSPANDLIKKGCIAISCIPEERTQVNCPDSCKSPKDDLTAQLCEQIGCMPESSTQEVSTKDITEGTKPEQENCPESCKLPENDLRAQLCGMIGCPPDTSNNKKTSELESTTENPNPEGAVSVSTKPDVSDNQDSKADIPSQNPTQVDTISEVPEQEGATTDGSLPVNSETENHEPKDPDPDSTITVDLKPDVSETEGITSDPNPNLVTDSDSPKEISVLNPIPENDKPDIPKENPEPDVAESNR